MMAHTAAPEISGLRVRDAMSHPLILSMPHMRLVHAYGVMCSHGIRHLPVVDEGLRLVGLLTEREVHLASYQDPGMPDAPLIIADATVADVMQRSPPTVSLHTDLQQVAARMAAERLTCLLVTNPQGQPVGLLTRTDLLRALTVPWLPSSSLEALPC